MMKKILGKEIRKDLERNLIERVEHLSTVPVFCDLVVGDDPASLQYVQMKERYARHLGIETFSAVLPKEISTEEVIATIEDISRRPGMSGLIVQLPLPSHIDRERVLNAIPKDIDVDCLSKIQSDLFYSGKEYLVYPTAKAVLKVLEGYLDLSVPILVIGTGPLVGKPVSYLLRKAGYMVTTVSKYDVHDVTTEVCNYKVIISATGIPGLIHKNMLSPETILVDAGTSESDGAIVGDVDIDSLTIPPAVIAPVPGGVGPLTVYYLMENVVSVAEKRYSTHI